MLEMALLVSVEPPVLLTMTVVNPSYVQTQPGACQFQVKVGDKILKSVTAKLASNEVYTAVA